MVRRIYCIAAVAVLLVGMGAGPDPVSRAKTYLQGERAAEPPTPERAAGQNALRSHPPQEGPAGFYHSNPLSEWIQRAPGSSAPARQK
jgi:hypothetical protein